MRFRGILVAAVLCMAPVAFAGDEPVVLVLQTGEKVEGKLLGFGERRYRVSQGGTVREIDEKDVRRIEFFPAATPPAAPPAPVAPAPAPSKPLVLVDFVLEPGELPRGTTLDSSFGRERAAGGRDVVIGGANYRFPRAVKNGYVCQRLHERESFEVIAADCGGVEAGTSLQDEVKLGLLGAWRKVRTIEILTAGKYLVIVADHGVMPTTRTALMKLVTDRLARAGTPSSSRIVVPLAFDPASLHLPSAVLPEPFVSAERVSDVPAPPLPGAVLAGESVYKAPGGAVHVRCYAPQRGAKELGAPTREALVSFHAVWHTDANVVTLSIEGDVAASAVTWLEEFIDSELKVFADTKDARRLPCGPVAFSLEDLILTEKDLPAAFTPGPTKVRGPAAVVGDRDVLARMGFAEFDEIRALHQGLVDRAIFAFHERETIHASAFRYGSEAEAKNGLVALRREARSGKAGGEWIWLGATTEIFRVRNVLAAIHDPGVTLMAAAAFRGAFVARIERVVGAKVESETIAHGLGPFGSFCLTVPSAWLPAGFVAGDWDAGKVASEVAGTYLQGGKSEACLFRSHRGEVEVFVTKKETPFDRASPTALKPFAMVWTRGNWAVGLRTRDSVDASAVEWFAKFVTDELERCADTRGAELVRATDTAPAPVLPKITCAQDLVPDERELPKGMKQLQAIPARGDDLKKLIDMFRMLKSLGGNRESNFRLGERSVAVDPGDQGALMNGIVELGAGIFEERARAQLSVFQYASAADAVPTWLALRRMAALFKDVRITVLKAGPYVGIAHEEGLTPACAAAWNEAVRRRFEAAAPGDVQTADIPAAIPFERIQLVVPKELLPEGLTSCAVSPITSLGSGASYAGADSVGRATFASAKGEVQVRLYLPKDGEKLAAPSAEEAKSVHTAWNGAAKALTLSVTGEVAAAAVEWLEAFLESELRRCWDTEGVTRAK